MCTPFRRRSRVGSHERQQIRLAFKGCDLESEQVGGQQHDQPVALPLGIRCVERAPARRGRERKIVQREVTGIVETSIVFIESRIKKAAQRLRIAGRPARAVARSVRSSSSTKCFPVFRNAAMTASSGKVSGVGRASHGFKLIICVPLVSKKPKAWGTV